MKHWADHQVKQQDFYEGQVISSLTNGGPAWKGLYLDKQGNLIGDYEVEIVPGSDRMEEFHDLATNFHEITKVVNVLIRKKFVGDAKFEESMEIWPLEWFNLTEVPQPEIWDAYKAYENAMRIFK